MIPNLFKIAGELTPFCLHVAARSIATHALSIFGDHSDVMCCRGTGFALLASGSVQEAHDLAAIAHAATYESRVPFLHFFDGFRTSHEIAKVELLGDEDLTRMIDGQAVLAHRERALTPDRPVLRGTAQNPDTFFQAREAANPFYDACPAVVESAMARFAEIAGRKGLQRAVHRAGGATLRLHLTHDRRLAPQVGIPASRPGVRQLAHRRGGGDRVDSDNLAKPECDGGDGFVAVHGSHKASAHGGDSTARDCGALWEATAGSDGAPSRSAARSGAARGHSWRMTSACTPRLAVS
jgi:hypothetical protein